MIMKDVLDYSKKLLLENPDITPSEMVSNLHETGYHADMAAKAVHQFFSAEGTDLVFNLLVSEYRHPLIEKDKLIAIMKEVGYPASEVEAAAKTGYPLDLSRYALKMRADSHAGNGDRYDYSFGQGDFTLEAWIKPSTAGTIIAKKGGPGGYGNGGFLLVLKSNGVVKFATDDGFGFYEINSEPVSAFDGKWHHVLCYRKSCQLTICWDFKAINATPRTNRYPELDVNNSYPLQIGFTDQYQEEFNSYEGCVGEVRVWNKACSYTSLEEWKETDWVEPGIVAIWDFFQKTLKDTTKAQRVLSFTGEVELVEYSI